MGLPLLNDREWLQAQVDAKCSLRTIARAVGCSHPMVYDALIRMGVRVRQAPATAQCPHCGEMVTPNNIGMHINYCLCNPAVHAATLKLLDDGSGVIVKRDQYIKRRAGTRAISHYVLRRRFGKWESVAAAFGLLSCAGAVERDEVAQVDVEYEMTAMERLILAQDKERGLPVCRVRQVGGETYCMLR